jgi:hypothetical protein
MRRTLTIDHHFRPVDGKRRTREGRQRGRNGRGQEHDSAEGVDVFVAAGGRATLA